MAASLLLTSLGHAGPTGNTLARVAPSTLSLLALLDETDASLHQHALQRLLSVVDTAWPEIAESVARIEALAEESAPSRTHTHTLAHTHQYAALLASKVYYHLEAYADAVRLALVADTLFDVTDTSAYTQTILARIIDAYAAGQSALPPLPIDARVVAAVRRMMEAAISEGARATSALGHALGVAFEVRRADWVAEVLASVAGSDRESDLLQHAFSLSQSVLAGLAFRPQVIMTLTHAYRRRVMASLAAPATLWGADALADLAAAALPLARCFQSVNDADAHANLIMDMLRTAAASLRSTGRTGVPVPLLVAYQLALDAVESENQHYLVSVHGKLPSTVAADEDEVVAAAVPASNSAADSDAAAAAASAPVATSDVRMSAAIANIQRILTGSLVDDIHCDFLSSKCNADLLLLRNIKTATDSPRNSVLHHAVVVAHGYMYAGTGIDSFLRGNLDWLGRATNWAKFSASASQGVVHKGRLRDSMTILESYLPSAQGSSSPYSEGGALYALGLIHANRGASAASAGAASAASAGARGGVVAYLSDALQNMRDEVIQHGACLGLGAAAMGTGDEALYGRMRDVMFQENAVVGEGAAIGIGLLAAGRGGQWAPGADAEAVATEMLAHAHDTAHEKTIRGISMALALMCYGQEGQADVLINQLVRDKDAVLRYGGMYAIGLAYVGTSSNAAVRQLLHVAVSDVSDDVRRAAVTNIGFVLARSPAEVAVFVAQLAESYNPHVRYGAAMAVGIACAGTGLPEAVGLLEPLLGDAVDFVRQGALLALGLVLQEETEKHLPKSKVIRDRFMSIIRDRHQTTMTKMGAIIASGLVDVAGRNAVVSMISRGGFVKMASVVGIALWLQYWYWFPLLHFLSLAITPTASIGICDDLGSIAGDFTLDVACPPSWYAYPEHLVEEKKDKTAGVTTTTLSITAKAKAKAAAKAKDKERATAGASETKMDVDDSKPATASSSDVEMKDGAAATAPAAEAAPATDAAAKKEERDDKDKEKEKEPSSYTLSNPARITHSQAKFVRVAAGQRYVSVRQDPTRGTGISVLMDTREGTPDASRRPIKVPAVGEDATPDAPVPQPFEWTVGEYA